MNGEHAVVALHFDDGGVCDSQESCGTWHKERAHRPARDNSAIAPVRQGFPRRPQAVHRSMTSESANATIWSAHFGSAGTDQHRLIPTEVGRHANAMKQD
jgi:hypothetical protein